MHRVPVVLLVLLVACDGDDPVTDGADPPGPTDPTGTPSPTVPPPTPCRPELVAPAGPVLEGDTVLLTLACTTGASGAEYAPRLLIAPDGATLDEATWAITFATDLADAGPHEVFVSIDVTGGVAETVALTVWVNDAGPDAAGNTPPDPAVYTEEFGLPVIWCEPSAPVGASYVAAPCAVDAVNHPTSRMRIEGPAYPKPSYAIDFAADPADGDALDMHEKSTLVLLSSFADNSYVREKLAHDLWKDLEDFWEADRPTPDTTFVVLYVAGAYAGLYVAIDPVDGELMEEQGLLPTANVYRSVSDDANFYRTDALGLPKTDLSAGWTKVEGGAGEPDLEALTAWAADSDADTVAIEAADWIRTDEFMDWYLLASYGAAHGSAGDRAYLYDDPIVREFRYIPGEYAGSFGQDVVTARVDVAAFSELRAENRLFDHFHASSQLSFTLWGRFEQAAAPGGPFDTATIEARLDEYFALIAPSALRDETVWGDDYAAWPEWSGRADLTDHAGEKAYLYDWVAGRRAAYDAARP